MVIAVPVLAFFYLIAIYLPQMRTQNDNFPYRKIDRSEWRDFEKKAFRADSEVQLLRNLLAFAGSEGEYRGTIKQSIDTNGNLVTIIRDDYVPDDSIGTQEQKFISKRVNGSYEVVEYSRRGSCKRDLSFLSFFIEPLWTDHPCP